MGMPTLLKGIRLLFLQQYRLLQSHLDIQVSRGQQWQQLFLDKAGDGRIFERRTAQERTGSGEHTL